jgi:hypothetical protein
MIAYLSLEHQSGVLTAPQCEEGIRIPNVTPFVFSFILRNT